MQHVFISYMPENTAIIDRLREELTSRGIEVWIDRNEIKPESHWKDAIRETIREGTFFIACFSKEYSKRDKTDMNQELTIAIDELRQQPTNRAWFIPVKLNSCKIPNRNIGRGETLNALHDVKLYKDWNAGIQSIIKVIQSESTEPTRNESPNSKSSEDFVAQDSVGTKSSEVNRDRNRKLTDSLFQQVDAMMKRGEIDPAITDYDTAIALEPKDAKIYYSSGNAYRNEGAFELAPADYNEVIESDIENAGFYNSRGVIYSNEGETDKAIRDFNKAIELNPKFTEAYYNRGNVYANTSDFDNAISDYTEVIKRNPNDAQAYNNRGNVYANTSDFDNAISDYTEAIKRNPNDA